MPRIHYIISNFYINSILIDKVKFLLISFLE